MSMWFCKKKKKKILPPSSGPIANFCHQIFRPVMHQMEMLIFCIHVYCTMHFANHFIFIRGCNLWSWFKQDFAAAGARNECNRNSHPFCSVQAGDLREDRFASSQAVSLFSAKWNFGTKHRKGTALKLRIFPCTSMTEQSHTPDDICVSTNKALPMSTVSHLARVSNSLLHIRPTSTISSSASDVITSCSSPRPTNLHDEAKFYQNNSGLKLHMKTKVRFQNFSDERQCGTVREQPLPILQAKQNNN